MRIEIKINKGEEVNVPILTVILFGHSDDYYLNGGDEGIFNCACTLPLSANKDDLLSVIEQSVNACLERNEKEMERYINNMIGLNKDKIEEFQRTCGLME